MINQDTQVHQGTGLEDVETRIEESARKSARDAQSVTLIAVSKTFDAGAIRPVLSAGHRVFGENRVQEAQKKWLGLKEEFSGVELHLIGPLQSNKVRDAVALFDVIHTIDRPKIARAISQEIKKTGKRLGHKLRLFVQVNTGEEPQKAGVMPGDLEDFLDLCRNELELPIIGLMCIPPIDEESAVHFAFLAKRAQELGLKGLSMGMSSDFETAIEFGASHIRVGSAIFGQRKKRN